MIKINLSPPEELENPLWWVPDASFAVLALVICYFGAQFYLDQTRLQVAEIQSQILNVNKESRSLADFVDQHKALEKEKEGFLASRKALSSIAKSKVQKFTPVIVLEHLQNLKPDGLWFRTLNITPGTSGVVTLTGLAFDNLIVAEFLAALRATGSQDFDRTEFRTYVYFRNIALVHSKREEATLAGQVAENSGEESTFVSFQMTIPFAERTSGEAIRVSFNQGVDTSPEPIALAALF